MTELAVRIMGPAEVLFEGNVDMVVAPGEEGDLGILAGHECMVARLNEGHVRLYQGEQIIKQFSGAYGWLDVSIEGCTILMHTKS
jgi:F-type H+-transporting ATPase subunit epsilon